MATTHTYSGGKNTYIYYKGEKMAMDSFTVAEDIPGEAISNVGDSYGDAGSAGIIMYSGSFSGRLLVQGSTNEQSAILASSNAIAATSAVFKCSSKVAYKGKIILTGRSVDASGGSVVSVSGNWMGADGFKYVTST